MTQTKSSFDRFGDDLTELILSYLTFEDKVRLECTAKQWRRLVYNKQYILCIEENGVNSLPQLIKDFDHKWLTERREPIEMMTIDLRALESVLKKCHNIKQLFIKPVFNRDILRLINEYCPRLKSLTLDYIDPKTFDDMAFCNFAKELEFFKFFGDEDPYSQIDLLLKSCPNLKTVGDNFTDQEFDFYSKVIIKEDKSFLPELQEIRTIMGRVQAFKIVVDKYGDTLSHISAAIDCDFNRLSRMKSILSLIGRLKNLKSLQLVTASINRKIVLDFKLMFKNLKSLLSLDLKFDRYLSKPSLIESIIGTIPELKSLQELSIKGWAYGKPFDINCLPHLPNVVRLSIDCDQLADISAKTLSTKLPKIKFIRFSGRKEIPNNLFESLSSVKTLSKVINRHKRFYYGKYLKKRLSEPRLTLLTDECGLIVDEDIDCVVGEEEHNFDDFLESHEEDDEDLDALLFMGHDYYDTSDDSDDQYYFEIEDNYIEYEH